MSNPLKDIFYISLPDSLLKLLSPFKGDSSILVPVQMPEGADSGRFSLEDICSAILTLLAYFPESNYIDYYKELLLSYKPLIKEDLLTSAFKKMEEKDFSSAETFFKVLLQLEKDSSETSYIKYNLAICLESQANFFIILERREEAQEKIQELKTLYESLSLEGDSSHKDKNLLLSLNSVQDLVSQDKKEEAILELNTILEESQNSWEVWFLKAWVLRKSNRHKESLEALEKALSYCDPTIDILMEQFISLIYLKEYKKAEEVLNQSLELDEKDSRIYFNFGLLFYRKNDKKKSLYYFKKGLIYSPEDSMALNFIESLEEDLNQKN